MMQVTVLFSLVLGWLPISVLTFSVHPTKFLRVPREPYRRSFATSQASTKGDSDDSSHGLLIEYCTGCRWMLRAAWMAQELLTTFEDDNLASVTLVPTREPAGVFCVRSCDDKVLWDRKAEGGFPEAKQLKQRVRNWIAPDKDLGHSDAAGTEDETQQQQDCETCPDPPPPRPLPQLSPNLSVTYCVGCRWLPRAAWMAQEILTTFDKEINSVSLFPNDQGGVYRIALDETNRLWDRKEKGRFPQPKEIKQKVRDILNPERNLGHSDVAQKLEEKTTESTDDASSMTIEEVSDDEAEEMRKYFGVM